MIFISYRREDSGGYAGRLHERLSRQFGRDRIFIDIDDIPAGQNFVNVITERLSSCRVLLVLIGKRWVTIADETGRRRLDDPADFVRIEIQVALERGIAVIPVLLGGAQMPSATELPGPIARLAHLNAHEIHDRFFEESLRHLVSFLAAYGARRRRLPILVACSAALMIALVAAISLANRPLNPSAKLDRKQSESVQKQPEAVKINPPVADQTPERVSQPPPIIESARNGFAFTDAASVEGPRNPKLVWQAAFGHVSHGGMSVYGVSGDGTLYLSDRGSIPLLVAIRDGKEQWAYQMSTAASEPEIALDGRVWLDAGERFLCFNSRGEGGRFAMAWDSNRDGRYLNHIAETRLKGHGLASTPPWHFDGCRLDSVSGTSPKTYEQWKTKLDDECAASAVSRAGNILVATESKNIYCINPQGRVLWIHKAACRPREIFPLLRDGAVYYCEGSLYGFEREKQHWKFELYASGSQTSPPDKLLFDKSNTVYLSSGRPGEGLVAMSREGAVLWSHDFGATVNPELLDKDGRLYVMWGSSHGRSIACLSDH